ncbi:amino acid ABC transporter permease [Pelagovum pacificum]|uniref:Amino acid ABC transporter permease n=1 Tax=Pelagovum pacificum TaxID=2588711 RepID=A0A5C5G928_9RHOB|nr:amino acid ABC transporter permease [Pelagovum pacificum]QQA41964.1 amino acid ABC transporter permease [Pelagovum pacificum]TNY30595.1 amino acid ABC transporter permease [Pelagovum pacificum]
MPALLKGALVTLQLTGAALLLATPLGVVLALLRSAPSATVRGTVAGLSWIFRGIPPLLLLFFSFFGLPILGLTLDPMAAAILAMTAYTSFYFAEAFASGLRSVPPGQWQAAAALGLSPGRTLIRIILPQTIPAALPPYISHATEVLKGTALAAAVAVPELTSAARKVFVVNYRPLEVLIVAAAIYAVMDGLLVVLQIMGERWSARRRGRG